VWCVYCLGVSGGRYRVHTQRGCDAEVMIRTAEQQGEQVLCVDNSVRCQCIVGINERD
jgi:hypothetical protein